MKRRIRCCDGRYSIYKGISPQMLCISYTNWLVRNIVDRFVLMLKTRAIGGVVVKKVHQTRDRSKSEISKACVFYFSLYL